MTTTESLDSTPEPSKPVRKTRKPRKPAVVKKLPSNPFMNEVLELVSEQKSDLKKIAVLQEYECDILKSLFIWNFDDSVISLLPQGTVPYKPNENPLGTDHSSLRREQRNLYMFVKGGNDQLSTIRRETIFIQLLEGLHPKEADIVIAVKDGALEDMYDIPFEIVEEAYPDIEWGGRS
jgi:hypothetical protein|tara:strand:+ start:60 stop:593 length:534 start_codon:yes stop_codon:yes gene_type:complete